MKYPVLIFLLFNATFAFSQQKSVGISIYNSYQFFFHSNEADLNLNGFETAPTINQGFGFHFKIINSGFHFETMLAIAPKDISIHLESSNRQSYYYNRHEVLSLDIGILAHFPLTYKKLKLSPFLGFAISPSYNAGLIIGSGERSGFFSQSNQQQVNFSFLNVNYESTIFIIPMLTTGISFHLFQLKQHLFEFNFKMQYSPRRVFNQDLGYEVDTGIFHLKDNLNGRFLALQFGLNYYFEL